MISHYGELQRTLSKENLDPKELGIKFEQLMARKIGTKGYGSNTQHPSIHCLLGLQF